MEKAPAIGIDLGTTYSCVAVWQYGMPEIIANDQGNRTTPSVVAFTKTERLVGDAAKSQISVDPANTVFDAKRLIGRNYDEESVQEDRQHFPFNLVEEGGKPKIEVQYRESTKRFTPEEISSMVLSKMKDIAEDYIGMPITNAVVTVPAYFNESQRRATMNAGKIAGLNVLRIINEPTAAAIAYGLNKKTQGEKNVLIFDLGGGTFDVTILTIDKGVFEVKSTFGDTHLGGEDFDSRLMSFFVDEFKKKYDRDLTDDKRALGRLRAACELAKRTLSSASQTTVEIVGLSDEIDFKMSITRAKFNELCADLFNSTLGPVETALTDAKLDKGQIAEIVMVGGSTRIPQIQKLVSDYFDGKQLNLDINPDEAIAVGAAAQAAILNGDEDEMLQELLLLDVTSLSLGVQTVGGKMTTLIPRNTTIPAKETKIFSTAYDNQTCVLVQVFQGERALARNNHSLGRFQLRDIPKAPSREPKIEVTFELDANGVLNVTAVDKNTLNQNQITIKNVQERNSKAEIERMLREAEAYKRQDGEHLARIGALNELKRFAAHIKAMVNQGSFKQRVDYQDWNKVNNKVEDVLDWIEANGDASKEDYERMQRELDAVSKPVLEKFKQNAKANPRRPAAGPENGGAGPSRNNARAGPVIEELD